MEEKQKKKKNFITQLPMRVSAGVAVVLMKLSDTVEAYANPDEDIFDFLKNGKSNGAFDKITETVKQTGFSFYNLLFVVGVFGLVIFTMILGISFAGTKNANKKSENKSHLPYIAIGGLFVFGAMSIIGLIKSIADKI